ncbi:IPT/TIG domain-containing protein [Mesoterricola sediminis]|uniref:IPT/TIG domain-containing protein n=1 Tax=Mesoterricola sediminis TaxID=2927980 RepID=A0AA48GX04_9BACT|nr:IPT/TIG domain-containing protein [Mesoterricola sediminis]BDU75617.1 hypothetical protein METESE_05750 [Mesoterricola sediminis]
MPRPPVPPLLLLGALTLPLGLACGRGGSRSSLQPAARPTLSGFEPAQAYPGDVVTLAGQNLTGADQVTFGGVQAPRFTFDAQGRIQATVPEGAVAGPLTVRARGAVATSAAAFTPLPVPPAPVITAFHPASGLPGTVVTLQGQGFTLATGVTFGGVPGEGLQILSDTQLTVRVPAGAAGGLIAVQLPAQTHGYSPVAFGVLTPPPAITGMTPQSGRPGDTLTLTGSWHGPVAQVTFPHGVPAPFVAQADGTLMVTVPPAADTGPLTVITAAGAQGLSPRFTVLTDLAVPTGFTPTSGAPGDTITLSGTYLAQVDAVWFGDQPARFSVTPDGAALRAIVPLGAVTGPITIQTDAGRIPFTEQAFTVVEPPVTVTGLSTLHALPGATVYITGTRLEAVTAVALNGDRAIFTPAQPGDTRLAVVVPGGTSGGTWTVTGPGGTLPVPGAFTVDPAPLPVLLSASPAAGVPGSEVWLAGEHLEGVGAVFYGTDRLDSGDWRYEADGRISLYLPDSAQTDAGFSVVAEDGTVIPLPGFTFRLLPSRAQALPRPLAGAGNPIDPNRGYPEGRQRSNLYADQLIPASTVFHPLDPEDLSFFGLAPSWTLDLALDPAFHPALPRSIREKLASLAVPPDRVAIHVSTQDYAYLDHVTAGAVWLMRPHHWTDAGAPESGTYHATHELLAGIFEPTSGIRFAPGVVGGPGVVRNVGGDLYPIRIETSGAGGPILAGPESEEMQGFNRDEVLGFWTLVVEPAPASGEAPRAEACLHLFLPTREQDALERACRGMSTLANLRDALCGPASPLAGTAAQALFADLWRPLVDPAATQVLPNGAAGDRWILLHGTGLGAPGLRIVRSDGLDVPMEQVQVLTDAALRVLVPAGTTFVRVGSAGSTLSDPIFLP